MTGAGDERVQVFVCGTQKGGTSSLDAHLRDHPQLSAPKRKEPHFFDNEAIRWRDPDLAILHDLYAPAGDDRVRYDATPITMFWPTALPRLTRYNPQARLIFLLRDPFDRAWSHWRMEYARGAEKLPFATAIREGRARLEGQPRTAPDWRVYSYLERGLYAAQLRRARNRFGAANMLVLRSEDLRDDHAATLDRIAHFLDIAPFPLTGPKRVREGTVLPGTVMPTLADRRLVADFVSHDLARLAPMTGLDLSRWTCVRTLNGD